MHSFSLATFTLCLSLQLAVLPTVALAKDPCRAPRGAQALSFLEIRARLAVLAGRCQGYVAEIDAAEFRRFLNRHKEWATQAEKWAGDHLAKELSAKASARSLGGHHFAGLIRAEEERLAATSTTNYCESGREFYRQWTSTEVGRIEAAPHEAICVKPDSAYSSR